MNNIGHNNPPTPFDDAVVKIEGLYGMAVDYLDGEPITTEGVAGEVSNLLNLLRKAGKEAEALRVAEKKPHDDAAKAVQAQFKPLSDKVKQATDTCKKALEPYLIEKDRIQREKAELARKKADEEQAAADTAMQTSSVDNLAERAAAEEKVESAKNADIKARVAQKARPNAKNESGRAAGIRTKKIATIVDQTAAAKYFWTTPEGRHAYELTTQTLADQAVLGGQQEIPGVTIIEEKTVV